MKLYIKKFPPITQPCEIDLSKKLILFVGKNNSGKTYISQLIRGIFDHVNYREIQKYIDIDLLPKSFDGEFILKVDEELLAKVSKVFTKYMVEYKVNHIFKKEMKVDFNISLNMEKINLNSFKKHMSLHKTYKIYINPIDKTSWRIYIEKIEDNIDLKDLNRVIFTLLIDRLISNQTMFLPSTRLFLPSFYKYIFSMEKLFKESMFDNFDKINEKNRLFYAPSYTESIDELIKKLIFDLERPMQDNKYLNILSKIMEGDISVDRAEEISMADISYHHKSGTKIPMYLSSSMVNQLATLYLYFKYWYYSPNPHSFLLLDEPEMNLHPTKKIEVMELLLNFASDNKLLIATHSSTVAKSLINYLHLFDLKEKDSDLQEFIDENGLDMNLDINLKSNDIAIYAFNGQTIVSYKEDNDSDIHFGTFTEVEELQQKQFDYIMEELDKYDS